MIKIGYALSSEEHSAKALIESAQQAEENGFSFALISDHFHPWTDQQGQSPFAWSVLAGIALKTKHLTVGTGVTCPIIRYHPAIIAQAAATISTLMPERFFLGVGTGENLNEHITGEMWPPIDIRQDMLIEAVEIIRLLWQGGYQSYYGNYFTVDKARIYSLPEKLPQLMIAASGPSSATIAGEIGDGLISTAPDKKVVDTFNDAGGQGKAKIGQLTVCVAKNENQAKKTALKWWPNAALTGQLSQELRLPLYFEQASTTVNEEQIGKAIVCSQDPELHIKAIKQFADAGFEHVYIHQVGEDQKSFFTFYSKHILPKYQ